MPVRLAEAAYQEVYVQSGASLSRPGEIRRRYKNKSCGLKPDIGHILVIFPGRRLLRVLHLRRRVNVPAGSAAIDSNNWFVLGDGRARHTWHAARIYHRCRLLVCPEAPCERMGSFMRLLWEARQGRISDSVVSRVLLAQAGVRCVGSERDEI